MPDPEPTTLPQFQAKSVNVRWPSDPDEKVTMANVFVAQASPDGIVLTLGQANPPIPFGPPETHAQQAAEVDEVPVHVMARLILTPQRAGELAKGLQDMLQQLAMVPMSQLVVPTQPEQQS